MIQIEKKLLKRKTQGNLRTLQTKEPLIDFASNDTLGFARSPTLQKAVLCEMDNLRKETALTGFGSTGSRLFSGNTSYTVRLEKEIAHFHGFEAGLIFSCGYMANLGLLSSIPTEQDLVIYDESIHASTHLGIRLNEANSFPFRHQDLKHLESRLKNRFRPRCFVCVESLYSTDGSLCPLKEISSLCKQYEARLIVDETHAMGIYGPDGKGHVAQHNLQNEVFACTTSFAKAFGVYGAIVMGSPLLISYLINYASSFLYSSALPLQNLAAIRCAYDLIASADAKRKKIQTLIQHYSQGPTHIQYYPVEGMHRIHQCVEFLARQGFFVSPLRRPTVKQKKEGLRICLHAYNTEKEIASLKQALKTWEQLHASSIT